MDLILSSGFLAFGAQCGFLAAVHSADVGVDGVVGTSSGALAGALFCAGFTPEGIYEELCGLRPSMPLSRSYEACRTSDKTPTS